MKELDDGVVAGVVDGVFGSDLPSIAVDERFTKTEKGARGERRTLPDGRWSSSAARLGCEPSPDRGV